MQVINLIIRGLYRILLGKSKSILRMEQMPLVNF